MSPLKKFLSIALALALAVSPAMADLTTNVTAAIEFHLFSGSTLGNARYDQDPGLFPPIVLTNGTGANQAQLVYASHRTLGPSGNEVLDLAGGLSDPLNTAFSFAAIKILYVRAKATNTNNVVIGNAASDIWFAPFDAATDTVSIRPGGVLMLVAPGTGWTVGNATSDKLKFVNSGAGTSVEYDLVIAGI
jgi:hypothetical protein